MARHRCSILWGKCSTNATPQATCSPVGTVRNGGRVEDLSVDFSTQLVTMGSHIAAQVDTRHTLSHRPVGPLTVTINGERVPEDAANGWTYDDTNQQIILSGQALNQNAAFTLEIEYLGQP
jgi:hypothetical protein